MIDSLCQRYGCPPSVILAEDAGELMGLQAVLDEAGIGS